MMSPKLKVVSPFKTPVIVVFTTHIPDPEVTKPAASHDAYPAGSGKVLIPRPWSVYELPPVNVSGQHR
jgi:hypothetical protein